MPVAHEPLPFAAIWNEIDAIPGWMTDQEAEALYRAALRTDPDGVIVEVGSFCGRSLAVLAESGRTVIAVDPLIEGASIAKTPINDAVIDSLQTVVEAYPNVTWQRCLSTDAKLPGRVDMLHIDGCHKHPFPLNDFLHFQAALVDRAMLAWHDYGLEAGVTTCVQTLINRGLIEPALRISGTMCITRYTKGLYG